MIYITGDTHGSFSHVEEFCKKMKTSKEDILIILGDAGINYYVKETEDSKLDNTSSELKKKKKLQEELPITLFCIHGNHEARPEKIKGYVQKEFHGGMVYYQEEFPNILFAKDGETYEFNGKKYIVIGGAYSIDKFYRLAMGYMWFEDEQPSDKTKQTVEKKFEENDWKIYGVLTHTCPYRYRPLEVFIPFIDQSKVDSSTELWLDGIEERLKYEKWYCGHYHTEKRIDKIEFMFNNFDVLD